MHFHDVNQVIRIVCDECHTVCTAMPLWLSFDRIRAGTFPVVTAHFASNLRPPAPECVRVTATPIFGLYGLAENTNLAGRRCGAPWMGGPGSVVCMFPGGCRTAASSYAMRSHTRRRTPNLLEERSSPSSSFAMHQMPVMGAGTPM